MTDTQSGGIEYKPSVPATIKLTGREIVVDEHPLATLAEEVRTVQIVTGSAEELVIGPIARVLMGRAMFAAGIVLISVVPLFFLLQDEPNWVLAVLGVILLGGIVFVIRGSLLSLSWLRFDRRDGRLVAERRAGFSRRRVTNWELPLDKVLAVQLLYNGSHTVTETTGTGDRQSTSTRHFFGYELNLVLDDPERRRVHLLSLADWVWVRETGNRIGTFLGVPVIDELHHGA